MFTLQRQLFTLQTYSMEFKNVQIDLNVHFMLNQAAYEAVLADQ